MNPELRQTLNAISRNFESANEAAQENIFTFTQLYIDPCLSGIKSCLNDCSAHCFPTREDRLRRRRARSRGRSDLHFDFYDDWDDEEDVGYGGGGWGNDELDSLLAGRTSKSGQPGRQRAMSYGARGRRKTNTAGEEDPNMIPTSSHFGFLERFPWRLGGKGLRYKPSAADLQENPGGLRIRDAESQPLIESEDEDVRLTDDRRKGHARQRSDTQASRSTTNSLSSRGDLIIGDEEDDAQPIDDEFAVMLSRRTTEDPNNRPGASRRTTRTVSSRSLKSANSRRSSGRTGSEQKPQPAAAEGVQAEPPTMTQLIQEEQQVRKEEEMEIAQKREAASQLAHARGLSDESNPSNSNIEIKPAEFAQQPSLQELPQINVDSVNSPQTISAEDSQPMVLSSPVSSHAGYGADSETEPFPSMPPTPSRDSREGEEPP